MVRKQSPLLLLTPGAIRKHSPLLFTTVGTPSFASSLSIVSFPSMDDILFIGATTKDWFILVVTQKSNKTITALLSIPDLLKDFLSNPGRYVASC